MYRSNLEPIEESDMDLEGKFKRGGLETPIDNEEPVFKIEKEAPIEISAGEKDAAYGNILTKVQAQQADGEIDHAAVINDAEQASQHTDAQSQVQHLVDIAMQKGIFHAVKVAKHLEDNYVLDTFHDKLLADELHDALLKKGMLKEI
jgi:hypothetical protein